MGKGGYIDASDEVQLSVSDKTDLTNDTNCLLQLLLNELRRLNDNIELSYDIDSQLNEQED